MERRLAAVLAADVAGYSRLMGVDEERTHANLKSLRKTLVDPSVAVHRGRIVKSTGDGILAEFASAVDATRCAVEIQRSIAAQNANVAEDVKSNTGSGFMSAISSSTTTIFSATA